MEVGENGWILGHTRQCKKEQTKKKQWSLLCLQGLATSPPFTVALKHTKGRSWVGFVNLCLWCKVKGPILAHLIVFKSNLKYSFV